MNRSLWRHGEQELRKYPVASGTVINRGSMCAVVGGLLVPASAFTWTTDLATTRANFVAAYVGQAAGSSADGEDADVDVDIGSNSVYMMDIDSASLAVGATLAPAKASGDNLEDQKVEAAAAAVSIARCHTAISSGTRVKCTFASTHNLAANNVNGVVG